MKKTKFIELALITTALASCNRSTPQWHSANNTYIRSDSTAPYTLMQNPHPGAGLLYYYAFRPYGLFYQGAYRRAGYYSNALSEEVNIGHNAFKTSVVRGGFGESTLSVES